MVSLQVDYLGRVTPLRVRLVTHDYPQVGDLFVAGTDLLRTSGREQQANGGGNTTLQLEGTLRIT